MSPLHALTFVILCVASLAVIYAWAFAVWHEASRGRVGHLRPAPIEPEAAVEVEVEWDGDTTAIRRALFPTEGHTGI